MPNKTIYVAAGDLPLFEAAAARGGGLSPAIAAALRLYLDQGDDQAGEAMTNTEEQRADADLVELDVAEGPAIVRTRFRGRRLARLSQAHGVRVVTYDIYRTARGRLALYVVDRPDWSRWSSDPTMWADARAGAGDFTSTRDRTLQVFDDVEEMLGHLPDDLAEDARVAMDAPSTRDLDI